MILRVIGNTTHSFSRLPRRTSCLLQEIGMSKEPVDLTSMIDGNLHPMVVSEGLYDYWETLANVLPDEHQNDYIAEFLF